jgi:hypothetical protein
MPHASKMTSAEFIKWAIATGVPAVDAREASRRLRKAEKLPRAKRCQVVMAVGRWMSSCIPARIHLARAQVLSAASDVTAVERVLAEAKATR